MYDMKNITVRRSETMTGIVLNFKDTNFNFNRPWATQTSNKLGRNPHMIGGTYA